MKVRHLALQNVQSTEKKIKLDKITNRKMTQKLFHLKSINEKPKGLAEHKFLVHTSRATSKAKSYKFEAFNMQIHEKGVQ